MDVSFDMNSYIIAMLALNLAVSVSSFSYFVLRKCKKSSSSQDALRESSTILGSPPLAASLRSIHGLDTELSRSSKSSLNNSSKSNLNNTSQSAHSGSSQPLTAASLRSLTSPGNELEKSINRLNAV